MKNRDLIEQAAQLLKPHRTSAGRLFGDVGAMVVSGSGAVYPGVCVDTPSWGLCAERSALATMVTHGEYRIRQIVAVWRNDETGQLHVLPPCGVCREFMRQLDDANLDAEIILDTDRTAMLHDLIPHHEWPRPLDL